MTHLVLVTSPQVGLERYYVMRASSCKLQSSPTRRGLPTTVELQQCSIVTTLEHMLCIAKCCCRQTTLHSRQTAFGFLFMAVCACQTQTKTDNLASGYGKLRHQLQMRAKLDPRHPARHRFLSPSRQAGLLCAVGRISKQKEEAGLVTCSWGWCKADAT